MLNVVTANPDKNARSMATPTWISLALGMLIFLSLFVIAAVIVLSLIPVYLKSKTVSVASLGSATALSASYATGLSSTNSQGVTNTEEIATALETNAGLAANTLVVNSAAATASSSSGRRRRASTSVSQSVPVCNGSSDGTLRLDLNVTCNPDICPGVGTSKTTCLSTKCQEAQDKLDNAPPLSLPLALANGSKVTTQARRCRPEGAGGAGASGPCGTCKLNFDDGINNFFVGDITASNTTVINPTPNYNVTYSTTDYVGFPTSAYSGTCANLCASLGTLCDSNYADCSNGRGSRFSGCSVVAKGAPCPGISIYADPNGSTGGSRGDPVTCSDSTDYCCCLRK